MLSQLIVLDIVIQILDIVKNWRPMQHAWVYDLLEQAEVSYLPEKQQGFCAEGSFPATISDTERAAMRDKTIEHMRLEIDVMLGHLQGEHSRCTHGPLKEDTTSFCCSTQVVKLTAYLGVLKKNLPLLLLALRKTHVQYAESNHSAMAKVRPKGTLMSATACFLGEALALLHVSELQLAAHGEFRSSLVELSVHVEQHLGVSFQVDVEQRICALNKRLRIKLRRATPAYKKKVAATKLRKRAALANNQKGTSGAYASGASSAALARARARRRDCLSESLCLAIAVPSGQDRTGPDRTGPDRTGPDRTGPDRGTGPDPPFHPDGQVVPRWPAGGAAQHRAKRL